MALSEKMEEISPWWRSTREDGTFSLSPPSETGLDEQNLPRAPSAVHSYTHLSCIKHNRARAVLKVLRLRMYTWSNLISGVLFVYSLLTLLLENPFPFHSVVPSLTSLRLVSGLCRPPITKIPHGVSRPGNLNLLSVKSKFSLKFKPLN